MRQRRRLTAIACALTLAASLALAAGEQEPDDDVEGGTIGTGIMGEITGLGSIHVGGARVRVPDGAQVQSLLGARPAEDLTIGETVVVEAAAQDGTLVAYALRSYYPLVAPVEAVSQRTLEVLGVSLDVSEVDVPELAVGDWVALSGLWRGNTVAVSHIRRVAPQRHVIVNGSFTHTPDAGQRVGPFALADGPVTHAATGAHLRVRGQWDSVAQHLVPDRIDSGLFSRDLPTLRIEGYLSQPDPAGTYFIYGSGVTFVTEAPDMRVPQARTLFCVVPGTPAEFRALATLDLPRAERLRLLEARVATGDAAEC